MENTKGNEWEKAREARRGFSGYFTQNTKGKQNKLISSKSDFLGSNDAEIKLATTTRSHDSFFNPVKDTATANTTSNTAKTETSIGVKSDTFKDVEAKPNNVEDWLLQRQVQLHEFGNIIVNVTVSGNSVLSPYVTVYLVALANPFLNILLNPETLIVGYPLIVFLLFPYRYLYENIVFC